MNFPPFNHPAWSAPGELPKQEGSYWYDNDGVRDPQLIEVELHEQGMGEKGNPEHVFHGYMGRWAPEEWMSVRPVTAIADEAGYEEL